MKKITPLLTTFLAFLLGAFWYSEYFLGTAWYKALLYSEYSLDTIFQRAVGFNPNNDKIMGNNKIMGLMAVSFILMTIMAYGMRWLMQQAKVPATYTAGFKFGLMISLFFVVTSLGIVYVYSGKASFLTLWAINAGYQATFLTLMATILAVW